MRVKIPLTGTLTSEEPYIGDEADPVRVIPLDLGDVAWRAVAFDWEAGLVEVELEVPRHVGRIDPETELPIPEETEAAHKARRDQALARVKTILVDKNVDELYELTGAARLKRPLGGTPPEG